MSPRTQDLRNKLFPNIHLGIRSPPLSLLPRTKPCATRKSIIDVLASDITRALPLFRLRIAGVIPKVTLHKSET
ncbi:MAG: hypothetical protein A2664_02595 [Candidatus Taylorbacteria bacterium RIFCSPHIGHO2_01_FULL_46_22b]|uniref:Uncharacterized protein n=1 Tax=Candidatus Taylorbacteria bacterium RIFCSPHIGHO2_01_FULL_46_22b TaxID=1802301 RepID=A0A1G2M387_9BACT|nr:MAG: hypothetical protein A2664_02595 [Candidatus Taylorbacteria bacterium RIFCSPHIGHO2_01_FULL_46_22b]